jgi:hypothetical protein
MVLGGKRYKQGDEFEVNDYVYNTHITRFDLVNEAKSETRKVVHNDEPKEPKSEEKAVTKKSRTKKGGGE